MPTNPDISRTCTSVESTCITQAMARTTLQRITDMAPRPMASPLRVSPLRPNRQRANHLRLSRQLGVESHQRANRQGPSRQLGVESLQRANHQGPSRQLGAESLQRANHQGPSRQLGAENHQRPENHPRNPNSQPRTREEGLHRRVRSPLLRTREESHLKGTARTVGERVNLLTKILDRACLPE